MVSGKVLKKYILVVLMSVLLFCGGESGSVRNSRIGLDGCPVRFAREFYTIGVREVGVNNLRWSILRKRGWTQVDAMARKYAESGLKLQVNLIVDVSRFLKTGGGETFDPASGRRVRKKLKLTKEGLRELEEFAREFVERYDGDGYDDGFALSGPLVVDIQVGSEAENSWGSGEGYAEAVCAVKRGVRRAGGEVLVLAGGFNPGAYFALSEDEKSELVGTKVGEWMGEKLKFYEEFVRNGLGCFDVLTIHLSDSLRLDEGYVENTVGYFKNLLEENGVNVPIWLDDMASGPKLGGKVRGEEWDKLERGDESAVRGYEKKQCELLVKKAVAAFAAGVERVFVSTAVDWTKYHIPFWRHQGLLTVDGRKKPAFYSFRLLVEELGEFERGEKVGEGVYLFEKEGGKVLVAWGEGELRVERFCGGGKFIIKRVNCTTGAVERGEGKEGVIKLSEMPIFVECVGGRDES